MAFNLNVLLSERQILAGCNVYLFPHEVAAGHLDRQTVAGSSGDWLLLSLGMGSLEHIRHGAAARCHTGSGGELAIERKF